MRLAEHFLAPQAAWLLLLAPCLWLVLALLDRGRERRLESALGARAPILAAERDPARRRLARRLCAAGLFLALLALLQPAFGESEEAGAQRGVDLLVCLDVSRSMLADDLPPNRLERAKREILALAERARGDRLALLLFAGEARLVVPLTQDLAVFGEHLRVADPASVARGGSDLGAALERALEHFEGAIGRHEAVLLFSDGEDHEGRALAAARLLGQRGIAVHCVGLGSARGAKIVVEGAGGRELLRDRTGAEVVSALDAPALRAIAAASGGSFHDAGAMPELAARLYEREILPMARKAFEEERRRERPSRFQWPLGLALALWMLERGIGERRAA